MTHVALVIPGLDRLGGAEQQVILLAKGLVHRNWRVSVVALSGCGGDAAHDLNASGVDFFSLAMRKGLADPRGWVRYHRWIRRHTPAIVHAHLPHAAWFARWSRLLAPPHVQLDTIHTSATGTLGRRLGYRWSHSLPDRVTAVSHGVAAAYLAANMLTEERAAIIPNGVDTASWKADASVRAATRAEISLRNEFLWFTAGRLEPVKNYPLLLRAFAQLTPPTRLIIAGAGAQENELRQLCRNLDIQDRVRFLGFEPNVLRWMQAADAFVLASQWEGLPMTLLEAGACAVPCVATDVPGSREIIINGQNGFLAAPGSVSALLQAMLHTMHLDPRERQTIGERAQQNVVARFSLESVLDQWEALYRELLFEQQRR
jgi:glycosyltransferase involved in cell wall biosynthesis